MRFEWLEGVGVRVAAMSEIADGDCGAGEARAAFCAGLGIKAEALVTGKQVHGTAVAVAGPADAGRRFDATDALVTAQPGLALAVSVADCVPVFLFDAARRVVALAHAGREGTRQAIAATTVRAMAQHCGSRPVDIHAVIGPSAGPCCYEVSEAMAEQFRALGLPTGGRRLDLWESNAFQLVQAGVARNHIEVARLCTICGGRFFSYRRGDARKRNLAIISL